MYRDVVTVFNHQKTRNGDIWYPRILAGVNLNMDRGAIVAKYGEQSQDNAILNVRYAPGENRSIPDVVPIVIAVDGGNFNPWDSGNVLDGGSLDQDISDVLDGGAFDWDTSSAVWVSPKAWQRLSNKEGYITFAAGDFFWAGKWEGGTPLYDENYGDLSFFEYMAQNYDFVYRITNVSYFSVIPHFEIAGR